MACGAFHLLFLQKKLVNLHPLVHVTDDLIGDAIDLTETFESTARSAHRRGQGILGTFDTQVLHAKIDARPRKSRGIHAGVVVIAGTDTGSRASAGIGTFCPRPTSRRSPCGCTHTVPPVVSAARSDCPLGIGIRGDLGLTGSLVVTHLVGHLVELLE